MELLDTIEIPGDPEFDEIIQRRPVQRVQAFGPRKRTVVDAVQTMGRRVGE